MPRSQRNKIRFQIDKAAQQQDKAIEHLRFATELAAGRSEQLDRDMPNLVALLEGCRRILLQFRDEL